MRPLPDRFRQVSLLVVDFLDMPSIGQLRRIARVDECWQRAVALGQLRAAALQSLLATKFPFTHAAYVLGLNGQHYSFDTDADRHYGIPSRLPRVLCRLFRTAFADVAFTTVRIQKFSSSLNFGGQHKTLPFSVGHPRHPAPAQETGSAEPKASAQQGYVLLLTEGCTGGRGELCGDELGEPTGQWRPLADPSSCAERWRWLPFPMQSWLRWYWPQSGQYFVITVTCEMQESCASLRKRERTAMEALGFVLPALTQVGVKDELSDAEPSHSANSSAVAAERPAMPPYAHIYNALRLLRFELGPPLPDERTLEERFRLAALQAHPDRAAAAGAAPSGWNMSQLVWARRTLRQAIAASSAQREQAADEAAPGRAEGAADPPAIAPPLLPAIQWAAEDPML